MGKKLAAVGMAAAIGVGGLAVAAVNPLGAAGAQEAPAACTKAEVKEHRKARRAATLAVIAEALGSTPAEVKAGLKDGTSVAAQAEAKGVDRQVVDDALTAHLNANIDAAVESGRLSEERAAKAKDHVDTAVDRILDADGSRIRDRRGN